MRTGARDVIHNFSADGFEALHPKYKGGRPRTFTQPERREIKKIATSKPAEHRLPFSTWSLAKLADFLVPHQSTFALMRNQANTATPMGSATR